MLHTCVLESKLFTLPPETLELALLYAEPPALASLSQTCRALYCFVYRAPDSHLWRLYFLQHFDDPTAGDPSAVEPAFWRREFCERWSVKALLSYFRDDPVADLRDITSMFHRLLDSAAPMPVRAPESSAAAQRLPKLSRNIEFLQTCIAEPWFISQPGIWPWVNLRPSFDYNNCCQYLTFLLGRYAWSDMHSDSDEAECYLTHDYSAFWHRTLFAFFELPILKASRASDPPDWNYLRIARVLAERIVGNVDETKEVSMIYEIDALRNVYGGPPDADWAGAQGRWKINFVYMFPEEYDYRLQTPKLELDFLSVCASELSLITSFASSATGPKSRVLHYSPLDILGHRDVGDDEFVASLEPPLAAVQGRVSLAENGTPRWNLKLHALSSICSIDLIGYQVGTAGSAAGVIGEWCYIDPFVDRFTPILHGCFWMWRIPSTIQVPVAS